MIQANGDRGIPPRGFKPQEFEARIERAQRIMRDHQLDAVLVTAPPNVRYFSGFDSQFWESPTRPWFVVVPLSGRPVAIVPEIGAPEFARTWIDDVRSWPAPQPADDGQSLLAGLLMSLPRRFGRVGAEMGREMVLRMPIIEFLELQRRCSGLEFCDGSPALWEMRRVKSDAEVARIRHICQLASAAYAAVPAYVRIGDTEREVNRKLRMDLAARGADATPFLPVISGPGGVPQIVCGPRDRELQDGDVLFIDTGSTFDGYFCDFDRNFAVGQLDAAAQRAHEAVWLATQAGIDAARPGITTSDLWRVMARILDAAGSTGNNVGRMGHGLGLQLTEPPSNMPGDETPLVAGMVMTIEPGMEYARGRMITHEENIVITDSGAELLTIRAPREMPVIA